MHEITKQIMQHISELGALVVKMDQRLSEYMPGVNDTVEKLLDGISYSPTLPPERKNVVLQLNAKVQNRQVWTAKEIKEMPYLKDLKYRVTKDGIHQFRYRRDGFNESFNSKNYEVAKKKAYDFIKKLKKVLHTEPETIHGKTFGYVAQAWLDLKRKHVDTTTYKVYLSVYVNHIEPLWSDRLIKTILPMDLQPYFNALFEKKERTCENAKTIIYGVFEYAVANRFIPSNPMRGVIVEKHFRKTGKALTDEQLTRFKQVANNNGAIGLAALIILYSGIRGFELQSLKFDWENGTFSVANAKLKKSQKTSEKNLYRTVPIFPALYLIKDRVESQPWIFPPKTLSYEFSKIWTESSVKDLRHTFTTRARECGIDNELVNLWTGHLPGKNVAANIYTHFSIEFQKREAKRLKPY